MAGIIALLTDFGLGDTYVGQVKGVILGINPRAALVDLTHEVRPQAILQGAFLLQSAVDAFPHGTVYLAVVDPGVGGERKAIAVRTARGTFVGPDNGLLSAALPDEARPQGAEVFRVAVPDSIEVVELSTPAYRRAAVSATFHGRDIFAPAAAHLSRGVPLGRLGPPVREVVALPPFRARRDANGRLLARIVHIDRFGNLITDARRQDLPSGDLIAHCGPHRARGPVRTYEGARGLVALIGSGDYLELAVPGGSATARTGACIGDEVVVEPA